MDWTILKCILTGRYGVNSPGSVQVQIAGSCEHGKGPAGSIACCPKISAFHGLHFTEPTRQPQTASSLYAPDERATCAIHPIIHLIA